MSLPVQPDPATVIRACIRNLHEVVVPGLAGEWERVCGTLVADSLQYALDLLGNDRGPARRAELAAAIEALRAQIASASPAMGAAFSEPSPFECASRLLVEAQRAPGPASEAIKAALHPVLMRQLDREFNASLGLLRSLAAAMRGRDD